jgi:hypothetical protein
MMRSRREGGKPRRLQAQISDPGSMILLSAVLALLLAIQCDVDTAK